MATEPLASSLSSSRLVQRLWQTQDGKPKFSKFAAYYVDQANIQPARCENCIWWQPPNDADSDQGACRIVESQGVPELGAITRDATCNMWNAGLARIQAERLARGRGDVPGILPGNLRVRIEQAVIEPPHTEPPEQVKKNLFLPESLDGPLSKLLSTVKGVDL